MWGGGQVTIDRSDFAARGDSMQLDQTSGFAVLVGKPRVQGKGPRPYALTGTRIELGLQGQEIRLVDRKSTRLNSSHSQISYAVFCLKKKKKTDITCAVSDYTIL